MVLTRQLAVLLLQRRLIGSLLVLAEAQNRVRLLLAHAGRLLRVLDAPAVQHRAQQLHRLLDGPVVEALLVAQRGDVVVVAPHLLLQLGVLHLRNRSVVEAQRRVLAQLLREVADVLQHLLHHVLAHLVLPDDLGSVEIAQQLLRELLRTVIVQQADHRLGQNRAQNAALADRHVRR